jgi:hypothetical protein
MVLKDTIWLGKSISGSICPDGEKSADLVSGDRSGPDITENLGRQGGLRHRRLSSRSVFSGPTGHRSHNHICMLVLEMGLSLSHDLRSSLVEAETQSSASADHDDHKVIVSEQACHCTQDAPFE